MKHLLLENSFTYKKRKLISPPTGFTYDRIMGAWEKESDKTLLIQSYHFPTIASKKEDVETGEDHKGQ